MTIALEDTTKIRAGTLVLNNDLRNPVVLAKELLTLDHISNGRVEPGFGAGWMDADYSAGGINMPIPEIRVQKLTESITIFKTLWRGGQVSLAGKYYSINEASGWPKPALATPKLLIGGGGKSILSLAAREAEIVSINPRLRSGTITQQILSDVTPEAFDTKIQWVRTAAGDRLSGLEIQSLAYHVSVGGTGSPEPQLFGYPIPAKEFASVPFVLMGSIDEVCNTIIERRARWGINYWIVRERDFEMFAPVVKELTGK